MATLLRARLHITTTLLLALVAATGATQNLTVGLLRNDPGACDGYTLFAPNTSPVTYLIDLDGRRVHSWTADANPGLSSYLLADGSLLRPANPSRHPRFTGGGAAGRVDRFDWDGPLLWQFTYSADAHLSHHDIALLPSGNVLMIAWELKTTAEAIAAGRNPARLTGGELWPDHIIEVEPTPPSGGNIVWEWHVWDHLVQDFDAAKANYGVVAGSPERVDLNASAVTGPGSTGADWLHTNAIDYNPDFGQILVSVHNLSEIWVIDHSTTTAEAAGHSGGRYGRGGDLLYRWGNPAIYRAGTAADRRLYAQHDARWVLPGLPGAGNITIFNNGVGRPGGNASSVDEIVTPVDVDGNYSLGAGPAWPPSAPVWTYMAPTPTSFYASLISGAHRLANGNILASDGPAGDAFEVTPAGTVVWEYVNPDSRGTLTVQGTTPTNNAVFRSTRYPPDYPALAGRDLTPSGPLERYPCTTPAAILYLTKTPTVDLRLSWDPACTSRYLRRSLVAWTVGYAIPFADSATTALDVPMPGEDLVFYAIE